MDLAWISLAALLLVMAEGDRLILASSRGMNIESIALAGGLSIDNIAMHFEPSRENKIGENGASEK
jgi:hypothetical protein